MHFYIRKFYPGWFFDVSLLGLWLWILDNQIYNLYFRAELIRTRKRLDVQRYVTLYILFYIWWTYGNRVLKYSTSLRFVLYHLLNRFISRTELNSPTTHVNRHLVIWSVIASYARCRLQGCKSCNWWPCTLFREPERAEMYSVIKVTLNQLSPN